MYSALCTRNGTTVTLRPVSPWILPSDAMQVLLIKLYSILFMHVPIGY